MKIGYNTLKALADAGDGMAKQALCQGHQQALTIKQFDSVSIIGTGRASHHVAANACLIYGRHHRGW